MCGCYHTTTAHTIHRRPIVILDKAKALVAALIGFVASYIAVKFGFNVPEEAQTWIVTAIVGLLTGFFTWLTPNTPPSQ